MVNILGWEFRDLDIGCLKFTVIQLIQYKTALFSILNVKNTHFYIHYLLFESVDDDAAVDCVNSTEWLPYSPGSKH